MGKENELKKEYLRSYTPAVSAARRIEEEKDGQLRMVWENYEKWYKM